MRGELVAPHGFYTAGRAEKLPGRRRRVPPDHRRRMMDLNKAMEKCKEYGQEHLLAHYEELSEEKKQALLTQIKETDFSVLSYLGQKSGEKRGDFSPAPAMELSEIEERKEELFEAGKAAIAAGKTAALLLAGGMGTRLGWEGPKGTYDIGETRHVYIFQRIIENLKDTAAACGFSPRLFVMTSEKNHDATVSFFTEHENFGYPGEKILFFKQDMAPACDRNGKIYMESPSRLATSPNGNAGWYSSLIKAGYKPVLEDEGIEYINVFAVDNVLQRILDPCFVGACVLSGVAAGSKVVRKNAPDEKVGVICLEDGRPSIVEYYELSEDMMGKGYEFGVILNYLFKVKELDKIAGQSLPMHVVEKKIPYMNEQGEFIKPQEPNGYKFEQLVLDVIHRMPDCISYEVVREKEFAPVKNATGKDSVESARELCKGAGVEI